MRFWGDLVDSTSKRVFLSGSFGRKLGKAAFFREVYAEDFINPLCWIVGQHGTYWLSYFGYSIGGCFDRNRRFFVH